MKLLKGADGTPIAYATSIELSNDGAQYVCDGVIYPVLVVGVGCTVEDSVTPPQPAPVVPESVTRRQAKQALAIAGLLANVQPAIDAITDPQQRQLMQIEWDDSQDFFRARPTLISLASALGLDAAALDSLFINASKLA